MRALLAPPTPRRWLALALVAGVSGVHLGATEWMARELRLGDGAAETARLRRIDVAFVRELQPAEPPAAATVSRPAARPGPPAPAPAASAPPASEDPQAGDPVEPPAVETPQPPAEPMAEAVTAPAEAAPERSAESPAATQPFEWPPSTRLSYALTGFHQGPVHGDARVEWIRAGTRYQVHLDVSVGPRLAPFVTRRMSSEGDLGEQGLVPRRYEETTQVALRAPRVLGVRLEPEQVQLANGRTGARPGGVQDTASQFVQMTWLFTTQPQRLQVGESVSFPLALPRRLDVWTYDVHAEELLDTPAGRVRAFHLKPRRESRRPGELLVDAWIAPSLQYLPVRIRIEQDEQTWADLLIERLPQQAEAAPPPR